MRAAGSVFLIGGGWNPEAWTETVGPFVQAAMVQGRCQITIILNDLGEEQRGAASAKYAGVFQALGVPLKNLNTLWVSDTAPVKEEMLAALNTTGVFVGGGLTPQYQRALCEDLNWLAYLRRTGVPYAGFSAGAAIAGLRAIVGGWKIKRGVQEFEILDSDFSEGLEWLEVRPGLGLVPFSVDVHASQWGTVSRLLHAVELAMAEEGWAIDENTMVQVNGAQVQVHGLGHAYHVQRQEAGGLTVHLHPAATLQCPMTILLQ